jgi:predicted nuclease of predicted toxin-antitoxin system
VGTLSSELAAALDQTPAAPRVYADANLPAGVVAFMRQRLRWDVFFVMEHDDLRRAADVEHFRMARRMHRTLITLDRDYFDDRRFPPAETSGIIVVSAPDERLLVRVLQRIDRFLLRTPDAVGNGATAERRDTGALPLNGRKVHAHLDWPLAPELPS